MQELALPARLIKEAEGRYCTPADAARVEGLRYWQEKWRQLQEAYPQLRQAVLVYDVGSDAGYALQAVREGCLPLRFQGEVQVQEKIEQMITAREGLSEALHG